MSRKQTAQPAPVKRRILIVDDHPLVRRGLRALINAEPDLIVCAEAATKRDALVAIAATRPDLTVVDLSLGDADGLRLVREIRSRHAGPRILVLTMHDSPQYVKGVLAAGADGYVSKQELTETLLLAIRSVLSGHRYGTLGT
jgi:DNA-binding NarL/FixJ family response regulator